MAKEQRGLAAQSNGLATKCKVMVINAKEQHGIELPGLAKRWQGSELRGIAVELNGCALQGLRWKSKAKL